MSNQRVVPYANAPDTIAHCKFDLSLPWGEYPDQSGQVNRRGDGCGPNFYFNSPVGMCEAYCEEDETWNPETSSCERPTTENNECSTTGKPIDIIEGEKYRDEPVLSIGQQFPIDLVYHYNSHVGMELSAGRYGVGKASIRLHRAKLVEQRAPVSQEEWARIYRVNFQAIEDEREFTQQYWRHNYAHLIKLEGNDYVWYRPRGKPIHFDTLNNGLSKVYSHLSLKDDGDTRTVTDTQRGLEYRFSPNGNLIVLKNIALGITHNLSYSSNGFDLRKIEHSLGGSLEFSHEAKVVNITSFTPIQQVYKLNFINKVTDSAGRAVDITWGKQYDGRAQSFHLITAISHPYTGLPQGKRSYAYADVNYETALTEIYEQGLADGSDQQLYAEFRYDEAGRAIYSGLANGVDARTIEYPSELTRVVINALGKPSTYQFAEVSGARRLTSVTGEPTSACGQSNFALTYNSTGQVIERNQNGKRTTYEYHPTRGLKTKVVQAAGTPEARTTITEWHETFDRPMRITEANKITEYEYTTEGLVERIRVLADGQQQDTVFTYSANGQLTSIDGPRVDVSDITQLTYNEQRNLSTVTNALGHQTQFQAYDGQGHAGLIIDANGVQTQLTYHARGWLLASSQLHPSGDVTKALTTTYNYDGLGSLISVTLPDGQTTHYEYDTAKRLSAIVSQLGERHELARDAAGNITQEVIKNISMHTVYSVTRSFDELSRLRGLLTGAGQTADYAYDVNDNLTAKTDGRNLATQYDFDALDQLKAEVDPLLQTTGYSYNEEGQVESVTDAKGLVTQYQYNGFGQLVTQASPDSGITHFSYDEAGNRVTRTDARGVVTLYRYDALNRLVGVDYPSNTALNQEYGYDKPGNYARGQLTQTRDVSGVAYYQYDYLGKVLAKHYTVDDSAFSLQFAYDNLGRLASMTYPSGSLVHYAYDALSRIASVASQANSDAPIVTVVEQVDYQPFGPMVGWTYGNGLQQQFSYDLDYRLTTINSVGATLANDAQYHYDASSNINAINALLDPATSQAFVYDELNRLASATGNYGDISYTYDAVGNRLSRTQDLAQENYVYPTDSHRLTAVAPAQGAARQLGYDANGNMISDARDGGLQWQYDAENRPAYVQVGGQQISYLHNLFGQRVLKQSAVGSYTFHYGLDGKLLSVSNGVGAVTEEHIWLGDTEVGARRGGDSELGYANLFLLAPAADSHVFYGEAVQASASATDAGQDISASIVWRSDLDGAIGNGAAPTFANLSLGNHNITAQVTSAAGKVSRTTRLVRVSQNAVPQLSITSPAAETYTSQGSALTLNATANDAEDGDLSASITWSSSLSGNLGSGASLSLTPTLGRHEITARVVDSFGLEANQTIIYHRVESSDSDSDGLPDDWEVSHFGNLDQSGADDADGDGISNGQEYLGGSHPLYATPINTLDPLKTGVAVTLSQNNTTITNSTSNWRSSIAFAPLDAGKKYYWEVSVSIKTNGQMMAGIGSDVNISSYVGNSVGGYGWNNVGRHYNKGAYISGDSFVDGDRLMLAYDPAAGSLWVGKNGIWQGDPVAATGAKRTGIKGVQYPAISVFRESATIHFNSSAFLYPMPQGFDVSRVIDTDRDGLEDLWEVKHFNNLGQLGTDDPDADGLDNLSEQRHGGDPNDGLPDSDNDGTPDAWEIQYFDSFKKYSGADDPDEDGFTNAQEYSAGTDPDGLNRLDPNKTAVALLLNGNSIEHFTNSWLSSVAVGAFAPGKKYYWEAAFTRAAGYAMVGVGSDTLLNNYLGNSAGGYGWTNSGGGKLFNKGGAKIFINYSFADRLMLAYDPAAGQLWLGKNGVWQGDPVTGVGAAFSDIQGLQYPAISAFNSGVALIFKPSSFNYPAPVGFVPSTRE